MFNNPQTLWIEIIAVILIVAFFGLLLGRYIYKKKHHLPVGECAYCKSSKHNLVSDYRKTYPKK